MSFVSMLNDASVDIDNMPLGEDYDENVADYVANSQPVTDPMTSARRYRKRSWC